jgi:hypothetical protein
MGTHMGTLMAECILLLPSCQGIFRVQYLLFLSSDIPCNLVRPVPLVLGLLHGPILWMVEIYQLLSH